MVATRLSPSGAPLTNQTGEANCLAYVLGTDSWVDPDGTITFDWQQAGSAPTFSLSDGMYLARFKMVAPDGYQLTPYEWLACVYIKGGVVVGNGNASLGAVASMETDKTTALPISMVGVYSVDAAVAPTYLRFAVQYTQAGFGLGNNVRCLVCVEDFVGPPLVA